MQLYPVIAGDYPVRWRDRQITHYLTDPEFRAYLRILGILCVVVVGYRVLQEHVFAATGTLVLSAARQPVR